MDALQSSQEASKHYASQYAGADGAVAVSRCQYQAALATLHAPYVQEPGKMILLDRQLYLRSMLLSHISTLCSAIKPALLKFRVGEAFLLRKELQEMLCELQKHGYYGLSPSEMEVTIAGLSKAWTIITRPGWSLTDSQFLFKECLKHPEATESTKLLLRARAYAALVRGPFDVERSTVQYCNDLKEQVREVIKYVRSNGLYEDLEWSTMARVASLVGMKKDMRQFALNDGRDDVLIKYGPFKESWKARLRKWKT